MKKLLALLAVLTVTSLTSCNTAIGFRRDMGQFSQGINNKMNGRTWDGQVQGQENLPTY